jgi:hypothetical protein
MSAAPALAHMGAKFEPDDGKVIHGLGQYVPSLFGYAAEMADPRYIHQPARPVPAAASSQRLILFALLLSAGVAVIAWRRAGS